MHTNLPCKKLSAILLALTTLTTCAAGAEVVFSGDTSYDSTGNFYAGVNSVGTVVVENGALFSTLKSSRIGASGNGQGSVTVSGPTSRWNSVGGINVGVFGTAVGSVGILNGGVVSARYLQLGYDGQVQKTKGTLTVDGSGSALNLTDSLNVGINGDGVMAVTNGATVSVANYAELANGETSVSSLTVAGAGSSLTADLGFGVGNFGQGTLNISSGGVVATAGEADIGAFAGSTGVAVVEGKGSALTSKDGLYVGYEGTGSLAIRNGATVTSDSVTIGFRSSGAGDVTVDGAGSTLTASDSDLIVGNGGHGSLTIINGATASAASYVGIGYGEGSTGVVAVSGPGSMLKVFDDGNGGFDVGTRGQGLLAVSKGGAVSGDSILALGIRAGSNGAATVDGPGSSLTIASDLYVGYQGAASLVVSNGGTASSGGIVNVATLAGSSGTVSVDGPGSSLTAQALVVGGGGSVNTTGTISIAGSVENSGSIAINGSSGLLEMGGSFTQNGVGSSTLLQGGGTLQADNVTVNAGLFGGNGTVIGNLLINDGVLQVGASPDLLLIKGNFAQRGGSISFEVDPDGSGGYLWSSLMVDSLSSFSIENADIVFDFVGGAEADDFFKSGLFNLNSFFTLSSGAAFGSVFDLGSVFRSESFSVQGATCEIRGFDVHSGAFDVAISGGGSTVPDISESLLLLLLSLAAVLGLRRRQAGVR